MNKYVAAFEITFELLERLGDVLQKPFRSASKQIIQASGALGQRWRHFPIGIQMFDRADHIEFDARIVARHLAAQRVEIRMLPDLGLARINWSDGIHCRPIADWNEKAVSVPAFQYAHLGKGDWQVMAEWIDRNLPYSTAWFFPTYWAFNIGWHERPQRRIDSYAVPKGRWGGTRPTSRI